MSDGKTILRSEGLPDSASPEYFVPSIEDRRLSRSDGMLRICKADMPDSSGPGVECRRYGHGAVSDLHVDRRICRRDAGDKADILHFATGCQQILFTTEHNRCRVGCDLNHVAGLAECNAKTAPLTDSEIDDTGVSSDLLPLSCDNRSGSSRLRETGADEVSIASLTDETKILAIGLGRSAQPEPTGVGTDFVLGHLADGQANPRQVALAEHV